MAVRPHLQKLDHVFDWLRQSSIFRNLFVKLSFLLGLVASVIAIATFVTSLFDREKRLRSEGVDCQREAIVLLSKQQLDAATDKLRCAEDAYLQSAELGDGYANFALANLYADSELSDIFEDRKASLLQAELHWCIAQRRNIAAAAGSPYFSMDLQCP